MRLATTVVAEGGVVEVEGRRSLCGLGSRWGLLDFGWPTAVVRSENRA